MGRQSSTKQRPLLRSTAWARRIMDVRLTSVLDSGSLMVSICPMSAFPENYGSKFAPNSVYRRKSAQKSARDWNENGNLHHKNNIYRTPEKSNPVQCNLFIIYASLPWSIPQLRYRNNKNAQGDKWKILQGPSACRKKEGYARIQLHDESDFQYSTFWSTHSQKSSDGAKVSGLKTQKNFANIS